MAATTFTNVKTVVLCGEAITDPVSVTVEYDGAPQEAASGGGDFNTVLTLGGQTRRMTVEALDPVTLLAASKATGACSFKLEQGGDGTGDRSYALGDGVGEGFDYDTNEPGQIGRGSASAVLIGTTFTAS